MTWLPNMEFKHAADIITRHGRGDMLEGMQRWIVFGMSSVKDNVRSTLVKLITWCSLMKMISTNTTVLSVVHTTLSLRIWVNCSLQRWWYDSFLVSR